MALKVLLLRSRLDKSKKDLEALRSKDEEFQKREEELEAAVEEMTEETPEDDRNEIEKQAEEFQSEKEEHEKEKSKLEDQISDIEREIQEEEERTKTIVSKQKREKENGEEIANMSVRTKFYGMSIQERDAFFAREDVKTFLGEVRTCIKEKRALNNAGLVIPEVMLELLKTKVEETSKLISRVNRRAVSGKGRQRIMGKVPEAIWTEMCARLNEMTIGFNDIEVDGYKVGGFFAVCNAILEDNDVNLASVILDAIGKAIGKAVDKAIVYGYGVKMPLGIVTRLAQAVKPSDYPDTSLEWKDLRSSNVLTGKGKTGIELFKEIVTNTGVIVNDYSESGLVWLMNQKTHTKLKVEAMGSNMNAAIVSGIGNTMPVAGGDIIELPFVPDDNIVFGYFDMYLLAERAGTSIGQSEHCRFLEDQTVFRGTARYDGVPVVAEAFAVMSLTTTAPQTSASFPADTANDAALESLSIGGTLTPTFNSKTYSYTATATAATVVAAAAQKDAKVSVEYNGKPTVNGAELTLVTGAKDLVITVENGLGKSVYTVTITKG